jgi:hypothetical protein
VIFRYVVHSRVHQYESLGWTRLDGLDETHHGHHAALMRWDGQGEPKEPVNG